MKKQILMILGVFSILVLPAINGKTIAQANILKKAGSKLKKGYNKVKKGTKKGYKKVKKGIKKAPQAIIQGTSDMLKYFPPEMKSLSKEKRWFDSLPKVSYKKLKAGDILLYKDYRDYKKVSSVIEAQTTFKAKRGSKYTTHAILYMGNGMIAEAIPDKNGIWVQKLSIYRYPEKKRLLIYRPRSKSAASGALKVAKLLATTNWKRGKSAKIKYSVHGLSTLVRSSSYGRLAKKDAASISRLKAPRKEMMCSEFVVLSYQYKKSRIKLHARHTAPIRLEDYLNSKGKKEFRFLGRVKWR